MSGGLPIRYSIRYTTRFDYAAPVSESQNELRAKPVSDARQNLVSYNISTTPTSRVFSYLDYWGTGVSAFGLRAPHSSLEITAQAIVETGQAPLLASVPQMDSLSDEAFIDNYFEYLQPSKHVHWGETVTAEATERAEQMGNDLIGVILSLHRSVGTNFNYVRGATDIGVGVEELHHRREGVCQDCAHLFIALCRSIGIPARYVSGYLFAADDSIGSDIAEDYVEVQTHAWAEVAIPGAGWLALDPTNMQAVGERHIKIGHGRDYDDVMPFRGIYSGTGKHSLTASVEIQRLAS